MEEAIYKIISPIADNLEFEIVRLKVITGAGVTVQIMLDRLDGTPITISDCTLFSRKISLVLEEKDPITSKYILEVSSPGINRPLVKLSDFDRFKHNDVIIKLKSLVEVIKNHKTKILHGFLLGTEQENILIKMENDLIMKVNYSNISKAKLDIKI